MFDKVLIANRGAIAVRVARTLRRLGVASLAVHAESDRGSLHVRAADEAVALGDGDAGATYLDGTRLLDIAAARGARAVHPGYGFLSENAAFARAAEARGIAFVGPTPEQIELFGLKHRARALAAELGVPLAAGSALLDDVAAAQVAAARIGYPVMLKSTAGGGGIGMRLCADAAALDAAFEPVRRLARGHFSDAGVFVERAVARARHVEVQVFGDGAGGALAIGTRDCSSQRRNQKIVEECPAPGLDPSLRETLHATAERLLGHVRYRGAGTVEFVVDADAGDCLFLEVNTRLQVEHGVTEAVYGIDLVEWMLLQAAGEAPPLETRRAALAPRGHAVQARLYAEDPYRDFRPSSGRLTEVRFAERTPWSEDRRDGSGDRRDDGARDGARGDARDGIRIDTWVETGTEVPPWFDPLLAKVIAHGETREAALARLSAALDATRVAGLETNLGYLRALLREPALVAGTMTTRHLDAFRPVPARIDVLRGGLQTTVQDVPGRTGYWQVGVPPSGPFDALSFRLVNRLLGNDTSAAGLEITLEGPLLQFAIATRIALGGAAIDATLDGERVPLWRALDVGAGQTLDLGTIRGHGVRAYLGIAGGLDVPAYLGSRSTFTLGRFGGHAGRALAAGDVLALGGSDGSRRSGAPDSSSDLEATQRRDAGAPGERDAALADAASSLPDELVPDIGPAWELRVVHGPHGAPDFFTPAYVETLFSSDWEVHYQSSRTGVRLSGPAPGWARADGGEAGLHPSNIHDNAYAFGTVDFTGDMPVILGPDGPSLGGFVCPATVIEADLWKLGQLRAGDTLRFRAVGVDAAVALAIRQADAIETAGEAPSASSEAPAGTSAHAPSPTPTARTSRQGLSEAPAKPSPDPSTIASGNPSVLARLDAAAVGDRVVYRAAGERFVLVEYGEPMLDIGLRLRAHALMLHLERTALPGIEELTPGIRSLQVRYDARRLPLARLLDHLQAAEAALGDVLDTLEISSRTVHLPLSWDDAACHEAIRRYARAVRDDAPWCPSNLEFIRRINGLDSLEAVRRVVFDAEYLVMGLGDVYLGAPVATPIDPRHRLVTTKYNPARTWTAENSVGIGGSYLCVYGMEGPGGYQFVGRTLQMWNAHRTTAAFATPWLLHFFDRIRFHPVEHEELTAIRADFPLGRYPLRVEDGTFSLAAHRAFLDRERESIATFARTRDGAFAEELARWHASGEFEVRDEPPATTRTAADWPSGSTVVESPVSGSLWQRQVAPGSRVRQGATLVVLESMKTEIEVRAPADLVVTHVLREEGERVAAGEALVVLAAVPADAVATDPADTPTSPGTSDTSAD